MKERYQTRMYEGSNPALLGCFEVVDSETGKVVMTGYLGFADANMITVRMNDDLRCRVEHINAAQLDRPWC